MVVASDPPPGIERLEGRARHAVRLEGPGDDAGAGRHEPEPGRRDRASRSRQGSTVAVIYDPVTDPSQDGIVHRPGSDRPAPTPRPGEVVIDHASASCRRHDPAATATTDDDDHHHDGPRDPRRIAVILGGRSSENAISLASAAA